MKNNMKKIIAALVAIATIASVGVAVKNADTSKIMGDAKAPTATVDPYQVGRDTKITFHGNTFSLFDDVTAANTKYGLSNIKIFTIDGQKYLVLVNWAPNMDFKTHTNIGFEDTVYGKAGIPAKDASFDYDTLTTEYNKYFISAGDKYVAKLQKKYGSSFADHLQDLDGDGAKTNIDAVIYCEAHPNKAHRWYGITVLPIN